MCPGDGELEVLVKKINDYHQPIPGAKHAV